jgi:hypothetical protein
VKEGSIRYGFNVSRLAHNGDKKLLHLASGPDEVCLTISPKSRVEARPGALYWSSSAQLWRISCVKMDSGNVWQLYRARVGRERG